MTERLLYRMAEAAEVLGVSRARIYELVNSGDLPAIRLPSTDHAGKSKDGALRISAEALAETVRRWARERVA